MSGDFFDHYDQYEYRYEPAIFPPEMSEKERIALITEAAKKVSSLKLTRKYLREHEREYAEACITYRQLLDSKPKDNVENSERSESLSDVLLYIAESIVDNATDFPVVIGQFIAEEYSDESRGLTVMSKTFELMRICPTTGRPQVRDFNVTIGHVLEANLEPYKNTGICVSDGFTRADYLAAGTLYEELESSGLHLVFHDV